MKWEKVRLGDVTDSCLGKMLDQEKNRGTYKPYLANINVRWGSFDLDYLQEMRFEDNEDERYGIKFGDIIVCEGGEPGRCAIWKDQIKDMKIQKALHRVRVHYDMDYRYVFYWFLLAGKQGALKQYYTGSTIMHLPGQKLKEIMIEKPPLDIQRKIGDYLEQYDSLIENNQKQIKLLEEAAQRLYKEWFVDLRFQGYEDTRIVDGVPEGWKKGLLGDIASFKRGKTITKAQVQDGEIPVVAGGLEPAYYHNIANTKGPVITVSGSGANAGFARLYFEDVFASDCSYVDSNTSDYVFFVYSFLKDNKYQLDALQKGSAQPHVYAKDINSMNICLPPKELIANFCNIVSGLYMKSKALLQQNKRCTEARDRLLPKLMSGELEV